ncbi:triose-phosphate transporter family-domain-containing protein [Tuber brumale]|nr:triose-phosphate transporter family-domain-containing protein [Tuber brumale]
MPPRSPPIAAFQFPSGNGNTVLPTSSAARAPSPPKPEEYWQPRTAPHHPHSHTRTASQVLGKMRYGRGRSGSVAQAAGEIADSLKAPLSPKLIALCLIWYLSSALSNTSSKTILNSFPQPVTLTVIQFAFVSSWCILLSVFAKFTMLRSVPGLAGGLRFPTRAVIATTAPLAIFQVGGHITSSIATQKIPVSLVHTIKGMSPLFTVFAYRLLFKISYSRATYISLLPLTVGVMLACSVEFHGNLWGITCAFIGAIIFVSQNIFSKKLFNESSSTGADPSVPPHRRKLDKLNLLCYSSGMAFLLTLPLWLYSEGFQLLQIYTREGKIPLLDRIGKHGEEPLAGHELVMQFIFNGTVHFGQNIIAFILLSLVSPVTYSVASLIKRIFVIVMAIVWFGNKTTTVQAVGISLTFFGLYLYDRAGDVARGERRVLVEQTKALGPLLPTTARSGKETPLPGRSLHPNGANGYAVGPGGKAGNGQVAGNSAWLAPGARQEDTWRPRETAVGA